MSDLYSELLVKREHTIKDSFVKYGLIVLTAIAVIAGLIITPLIWIVAVALGIACYFVIPKTDVRRFRHRYGNGENKKKESKEFQIIRGRSGSTVKFPQNGLL